jgi:hypothetical protein
MRSGLRAVGALRPDGQPAEEPVALETAVVATGARPSNAGAKRELFTEETQTVLVFEKGAVIRLSAAVADGQLLFLTNKRTGKEVVTQVVRKRSFRPTSCYVDLEFTEASPGFWGIEFPKAAPTMPSQRVTVSGEDDASDSAKHTAPPDLQKVERLKKEVSELQTQLKTLIGSGPSAEDKAGTPPAVEVDASSGDQAKQHEEKMLVQLLAQEAEQEKPHGPKRLVAYPQKGTSSAIKTAGKVATAGAVAAVIVAAGIAAYRFGLLDSWVGKAAAAKPAPSHTSTAATPAVSAAPRSANVVLSPPNADPLDGPHSSSETKGLADSRSSETLPASTSITVPPVVGNQTRAETGSYPGAANVATKDTKRINPATKGLVGSSSGPAAPISNSPGSAIEVNTTGTEEYVGPKLLRAVKPVSPPEALRNYITGSVNVDALVDATGHVKSVTVVSGPQKLWKTAIEQMKQYVYEPARKNGKPVTSHVQTSLQYWYEP